MAKVPTASLVVPWRELHSMAWFWLQEEREVEFSDDLLVFLFYFILFFFFLSFSACFLLPSRPARQAGVLSGEYRLDVSPEQGPDLGKLLSSLF